MKSVAIRLAISTWMLATAGHETADAQAARRPSAAASSSTVPVVPRGCPTPAGIARAISPGEVVLTTPDAATETRSAGVADGRTVFYGPILAADTGTPARKTTVRTHAGGEVAGPSARPPAHPVARPVRSRAGRSWTVQVASYETFDQAQAMQAALCGRGYEARIIGAVRPYTVRVGHYATSDSALAIARRLTNPHLTVFVTPAEAR